MINRLHKIYKSLHIKIYLIQKVKSQSEKNIFVNVIYLTKYLNTKNTDRLISQREK
jgi:hypothetical protein